MQNFNQIAGKNMPFNASNTQNLNFSYENKQQNPYGHLAYNSLQRPVKSKVENKHLRDENMRLK